ncbi:flagellar hook-associated protein FlgL [Desulfocicer niacini]
MRIANTMVYNMVRSNLGNITSDLNDATETAITGKRILKLSDDPIGLTKSLGIRSSLDGFEQVERGISLGNTWLTASENTLTQTQNLVTDTKTLAIQMANAPISHAERQSAAGIVQNTMEEIISLANIKVDDRYLFSGSQTNVPAFTLDEENTANYNGDSNPFSIKIGDSTVTIGNDGEELFGNLFDTLKDFKAALEGDDLTGINTAMTALEEDFNRLNTAISTVGTKMNRMDIKSAIYQDLTLSETERLSGIENVDITEAITNLQQKQLVYQAALASSSKVMELSLLDYL